MKRLDVKDIMILQMFATSEKDINVPSPSIMEIRDALPGVKSVATVHYRLQNLEDQGLLIQPSPKQPRSRRITDAGKMELGLGLTGTPQI
jgi:repressor of nif and glnA expression